MTISQNAGKFRCRKMAWMREDWPWFILFSDAYQILRPKWARASVFGYQHLELTNTIMSTLFPLFGIDNIEKRINAEFQAESI
jgi:hypothetical protein